MTGFLPILDENEEKRLKDHQYITRKTFIRRLVAIFSSITIMVIILGYLLGLGSHKYNYDRFPVTFSKVPSISASPENLKNLIIVPGHAIWMCNNLINGKKRSLTLEDSPLSDKCLLMEDYQKDTSVGITIKKHIIRGLRELKDDKNALLVFSGGQTKIKAGPVSEAQSYWYLANSFNWFGLREDVTSRTTTEDHSTDSYQNLLFSICRFKEATGSYPEKITVVGHDFKERRYVDLHRNALGFPEDSFKYIGLKTDGGPSMDSRYRLFEKRTYKEFEEDPYGCNDNSLVEKKHTRNPFNRKNSFVSSCPEMAPLLNICESTGVPSATPYTSPWADKNIAQIQKE
eukprot:GHVP01054021.1.p1 GENE.GHVP01054021.1~~GHVP01054021.1.p1  ORF type:complete len:344 (+),score=52.99 GHVP01054021.1:13-1044(+)